MIEPSIVVSLLKKHKKSGLSYKELVNKAHIKTKIDKKKLLKYLEFFSSRMKEKNYYIKDKNGKRRKINRWVRYWFIE
jgi:hypothetical protein